MICADKFQAGYDEPLLHNMYVDKPLSGAQKNRSRLPRMLALPDDMKVAPMR